MPFVTTGDLQTGYTQLGAGPALILIHGMLVDRQMWLPQIAALAPHYTVVAYDVRGHGQSRSPLRRAYTSELLVADLRALITELRLVRPIICGLSLGGMIAQAYAATYPSELAALILCNTAVSSTLSLSDKLQTYTLGWSLPLTLRLLGAQRFVDYSFWLARRTRGTGWVGNHPAVQAYVQACMRSFTTEELARFYRFLLGFPAQDLARIQAPTLIILGEYESPAVQRQMAYLRRQVADTRTAIIPGAGHVANLEQPAAFNAALLAFLAEVVG